MDARTRQHIFEPFFTTKPPGKGTGLGLAVVHGVVQAHDGAVTVDTAPGRGTTVHVYIPAAPAAANGAAAPPAPPRGRGELVLLVDDDAAVVTLGRQLLERLGYRADAHTDPHDALEAFRTAPGEYAAVLTDVSMPNLSGPELAERIRAVRPDVPLILTSGYLAPPPPGRPPDYGPHDFLAKPFTLPALAQVLHVALNGKG
jgi:CheY-like chemotaxis protein